MATITLTELAPQPAMSLMEEQLPPQLDSKSVARIAAHPAGRESPTVSPASRPPEGRTFDVAPSNMLSRASRHGVTALIIFANLVQFGSNFLTINGGFYFTKELGRVPAPGQSNWMAAGYPLTQSTFVLISGRLGAVYGHQRILLAGGAILAAFSLANAFCTTSFEAFVAVRALTGIGGGLIMPNAVAMITIMVPPGQARNVCLGFFGASAPVGGWLGAIVVGVFTKYTEWKWLFIFMAGLITVIFAALFFVLPKERPVDKDGKIDYFGAFLGLGSLLLFNFVWNQAPSVGWAAPSEIACLVVSVVMFVAFLLWESKVAADPIMPLSIFRGPTFGALIFVVLVTYMSFGISQWYMIAWQQLLRGWSVMDLAIGWLPFVPGATLAVFLAAWLIPRMPAQYIMAIGISLSGISNVLLGTMPVQQNYWAQTFPAIVLGSACPDFVYVAAQIIASNSVGRRQQGVAGSLVGTLNLYGVSLGLGFAGTMEIEISKSEAAQHDEVLGYRAALWFGFALAAAALALDFAFVRMPKDEREGWADESDEDQPAQSPPVGTATGVDVGHTA